MLEKDLEIKSTNKQWRKLVDYYNQLREEKFWEKWHFKYTMRFDEVHLVSKKMWFIEWLVKNDKIELSKLEKIWREETVYMYNWQYREIVEYSDYESLLMLLSISDNPIEFLCSVLK